MKKNINRIIINLNHNDDACNKFIPKTNKITQISDE